VNNNDEPKSVTFNHTFNFLAYAYYVEIKVKRTTSGAANNPNISLVRLTHRAPE
jgi:hypothetical protein